MNKKPLSLKGIFITVVMSLFGLFGVISLIKFNKKHQPEVELPEEVKKFIGKS